MKTKRRGRKDEVGLFKPPGAATWWIRYTTNGKQHRANTDHTNEAEARIFAANVARNGRRLESARPNDSSSQWGKFSFCVTDEHATYDDEMVKMAVFRKSDF